MEGPQVMVLIFRWVGATFYCLLMYILRLLQHGRSLHPIVQISLWDQYNYKKARRAESMLKLGEDLVSTPSMKMRIERWRERGSRREERWNGVREAGKGIKYTCLFRMKKKRMSGPWAVSTIMVIRRAVCYSQHPISAHLLTFSTSTLSVRHLCSFSFLKCTIFFLPKDL